MLTLKEYLAKAPKKVVGTLFKDLKDSPKGIVPSSLVIEKVYQYYIDKNQLASSKELSPLEIKVLHLVYSSENKGLKEFEVTNASRKTSADDVSSILHKLRKELWIYSKPGNIETFFGFKDFSAPTLDSFFKELTPVESKSQSHLSFRFFLVNHLIYFLGQINLGKLKIAKNGDLHRKGLNILLDKFTFGKHLSESLPESELKFIYNFCLENDLIHHRDFQLCITDKTFELLESSINEIETTLMVWWYEQKISHPFNFLTSFLSNKVEYDIVELSNLFGLYNESPYTLGSTIKKGLTWEQIPQFLQDMWLLGMVDFHFAKGKIQHLIPNPEITSQFIKHKKLGFKEATPFPPQCLPNFEFYLHPNSPPRCRFLASGFAEKRNDEHLSLFRFTKSSIIEGLQADYNTHGLETFLTWLNPDDSSQKTISEWIDRYHICEFSQELLLKVRDKDKLDELKQIPEIKNGIKELIPGYGFLIHPEFKDDIYRFLNHLDLYPGDLTGIRPPSSPLSTLLLHYKKNEEAVGDINYSFLEKRRTLYPTKEKTSSSVLPGLAEKLDIIEQATREEKLLELSFINEQTRRITIKPLHLLKSRDPIRFIGIETESGHRKEFILDTVSSLRITT